MTHGSLFSGIGGFDLAAEWAGWQNVFNCEIDPFCQKVLKYHFPDAKQYSDVKTTDFTIHRGTIDVLTGGFPCQDISIAGKKIGIKGKRSGLFYENIRAVDEIRPKFSIWENVSEVIGYLPEIIDSYSKIGYCLSWHNIQAKWFGLPHKRERIFGIAYNTNSFGFDQIQNVSRNIEKEIFETSKWESGRTISGKIQRENIAGFMRVDDGIPQKLHYGCIKYYGNAIVPQVSYQIFKAINQYEKNNK